MTLFILFIITIISLYVFYRLVKASIREFNYPLISIFFLIKFFLFAYIGVLIHIFYQGYYEDIYYLNQFILSSATIVFLPLGMLLVTKLTKSNKNFIYDYKIDYEIDDKMFYVFIGLFLISFIVLILYISKLEMLPITAIVKGLGSSYAAELRSHATTTFPGKYYRYQIFMKDLALLLFIILFFYRNISLKWKTLFIVVLFFNIFVTIMDIQKAPLVKMFLILLIMSFFYFKKINYKLVIFLSFIIGISIIIMYMFFMGYGINFVSIIKEISRRIFFAQIDAFIYTQQYIEANGFLYGKSFPNPKGIFPFDHVPLTTEVFKFLNVNWQEGMSLGSFPTVFYGDWYANFGYIGAFFGMFLLGIIIQYVDIKMFKTISTKKSAIVLGLYIYMIDFFSKYAGTDYNGLLIDMHLWLPFLVTMFLYSVNLKLQKRKA
ncbi:oligosaccharide repeat unit polymerase [Aliarcobacter cryaerophilus]|uniref:O-antigen polymerase n=1 Tax=Aliarcobacter cryaerophilus TaxID=28198 RepID=UPI003DA5CF64